MPISATASSPLFDGLDPNLVAAAMARARRYCGWHIGPSRTDELLVDGSGGHELDLPTLHVDAVHAVIDDSRDITEHVDWSAKGILHHRRGRFTRRLRGVEVSLTHGFEELPEDLAAVVAALTTAGIGGGAQQMTAGPFSISRGETAAAGVAGLSAMHLAALDSYRLQPAP